MRTCQIQTAGLRSHVAQLQWSRIDVSADFAYARIPEGFGRLVPWGLHATAAVDGTRVEVFEDPLPPDMELSKWLRRQGDRYTILRPARPVEDPMFLMATATTKVAFLRAVIDDLEPYAVVRLIVRPAAAEEPPWRPSSARRGIFEQATARSKHYTAAHYQRLREASLSAAAGCPGAVDLVNLPGMHGPERLERLADIFERCQCSGDMQTLAALYWWMTFERSRPARWLPWDPALAAQLGDDATYEQLVLATIARETNPAP